MVDARRVVRRQFQEGGGQVGDVHWATDVVSEQGAVASAGGEFAHGVLMHGTAVADDQRGASDGGLRMHDQHTGLGCRLSCSVRSDRVRRAGLVIGDPGAGEHRVAGYVNEATSVLRGGDSEPHRALRRSPPIGLVARCIDDEARIDLGHDGVQTPRFPQVKRVPGGMSRVTGLGGVRGGGGVVGAVACRTSSAPRKPLPPMIRVVICATVDRRRWGPPETGGAPRTSSAGRCGPAAGQAAARRRSPRFPGDRLRIFSLGFAPGQLRPPGFPPPRGRAARRSGHRVRARRCASRPFARPR